jgi:hypothetical protein
MQDRDVERGRFRFFFKWPESAQGWWLAVPLVVGCGGGDNGFKQTSSETDGVITTSVDGGDEGLDETGVEPPHYCIYNSDNGGLVGVKHQCSLEYDLAVTFTVTLADGSSFDVPLSAFAVLTASDESTYEHPFVMACCTDIRDAPGWPFEDTCITYHHEACMSDFIQHVCNAPGNWLAAAADDFLWNGKEAIEAAAEWLNEHKQECYDHFWKGPDALQDAMLCDAEFDGFFDHTPWEPSETFQYVLPLSTVVIAEVSDIVVAPSSAFGQNVPIEPPTPGEACSHPDGNNGEVPPLEPLEFVVDDSFAPVAPAPIEMAGPVLAGEAFRGLGDVGTGSVLQWTESRPGELSLERWAMTEAAATVAGTPSLRVDVDHFKLALARPVTAKAVANGWRVAPGAARFFLGATVEGQGYDVQATNSSDIELHKVSGGAQGCPTQVSSCLVSGPFTIVYDDEAAQSWKLSVPAITWQP